MGRFIVFSAIVAALWGCNSGTSAPEDKDFFAQQAAAQKAAAANPAGMKGSRATASKPGGGAQTPAQMMAERNKAAKKDDPNAQTAAKSSGAE